MNERIKELHDKAFDGIDILEPNWFLKHNKKFAELIVRECVGLIRKQSIGSERIGGQHFKTVQLGETIATITEHFGVKE